jgi:hypothetical protein
VKKPVSKFAFQVHNLQRYTAVPDASWHYVYSGGSDGRVYVTVGLCTLNQVDP